MLVACVRSHPSLTPPPHIHTLPNPTQPIPLRAGCERDRGMKSTSELNLIGHIKDDEESLKEDEESGNKRQEMEERRKKMMRLKGKKKGKKPSAEAKEQQEIKLDI